MTPDRPHPDGWDAQPAHREAREAGGAVEPLSHHGAIAGSITLEVNGKAVSGGYDITPRKGYIALESEGAPAMFRNLRIRELPSAGALPADQVASADEGYRSLYTGGDLSGWTEDGTAGHFAPADWQIAAGGAGRHAERHAELGRARFRTSTSSSTGVVARPGRTRSPRRRR